MPPAASHLRTFRALRRAALACALALVAAASAADDGRLGIHGRDDRVMLDPTTWPWASLGRLNLETGAFCTGALVAPDVVLTAAHCLKHRRTRRRVEPGRLHFLAGYRRGEYQGHSVAERLIFPGTGETTATSRVGRDWALVVLATPLDLKPLPVRPLNAIADGDDAASPNVLLAGYGRDRKHLLSLHDGCRVLGRMDADRILVHDCDAVPGESGSPLIVAVDGGYAIIGVMHGVTRIAGVPRGLAVHATAFLPALRRLTDAEDASGGP